MQGAAGDNLALHHAVLAAPPGSVLVADHGAGQYGHWGEVLAVAARARGIAGLLIDGGARDAAEQQALGFPVFSRNNAILGTRKDFPGVLDVPVVLGGRTIHSGDLVVGDADGVIALRAGEVEEVLAAADARVSKERAFIERLRAGATTLDLYGFVPRGCPA